MTLTISVNLSALSDITFDLLTAEKPKALVIFAHGAGADKDHQFINEFSQLLLAQQISVLKFNFPFMVKRAVDGKRRPPDKMPILLQTYQEILAAVSSQVPIYLAGKSMGSRVAAMLNGQVLGENVRGVIAIGYPFHPVKKTEKLRLAPLQEGRLPVLICQGDRDALGDQDEISGYLLPKHCRCVFFIDGDHDLKPRVKSGYTQKQHLIQAAETISGFIDEQNYK